MAQCGMMLRELILKLVKPLFFFACFWILCKAPFFGVQHIDPEPKTSRGWLGPAVSPWQDSFFLLNCFIPFRENPKEWLICAYSVAICGCTSICTAQLDLFPWLGVPDCHNSHSLEGVLSPIGPSVWSSAVSRVPWWSWPRMENKHKCHKSTKGGKNNLFFIRRTPKDAEFSNVFKCSQELFCLKDLLDDQKDDAFALPGQKDWQRGWQGGTWTQDSNSNNIEPDQLTTFLCWLRMIKAHKIKT